MSLEEVIAESIDVPNQDTKNVAAIIANYAKYHLIDERDIEYVEIDIPNNTIDPIGTMMEDNGVRETDLDYRYDINQEILRLITLYPPKKLVVLRGSTGSRINTILDNIF